MKRAMRVSGACTKSAAVPRALEIVVRLSKAREPGSIARGKFRWEGDLSAMRRDRQSSQ